MVYSKWVSKAQRCSYQNSFPLSIFSSNKLSVDTTFTSGSIETPVIVASSVEPIIWLPHPMKQCSTAKPLP